MLIASVGLQHCQKTEDLYMYMYSLTSLLYKNGIIILPPFFDKNESALMGQKIISPQRTFDLILKRCSYTSTGFHHFRIHSDRSYYPDIIINCILL